MKRENTNIRGKYYYEVSIVEDGLCRLGWSTKESALKIGKSEEGERERECRKRGECSLGSLSSLTTGTDDESWGFGGTGKKSHSNRFDDYGQSFTKGDVIGCMLDLDNGTMRLGGVPELSIISSLQLVQEWR